MYKYTYIQAAGGKRITKRHKVRLLTIAGERSNGSPQRSPPGCNQAPASGRSTTPTRPHATHHAPTHKRAQGLAARPACPACPACPARPAGSIFARYFQRRGADSIVYRLGA